MWRAIRDAEEFGRWFGVRFDGPFVAVEPHRRFAYQFRIAGQQRHTGHPARGGPVAGLRGGLKRRTERPRFRVGVLG
ncbi:hypothetical protein [Mycobacterium sp. M23085]|uniref:hypothetical protein n=1 Tax=Mycobacterium sp. M23085 TaxID=3378087 RepID=UPI003877E646